MHALVWLVCGLVQWSIISAQGTLDGLKPAPHYTIKVCKHGTFVLNDYDSDISEHMRLYGEWAEGELQMFLQLIQPDDIVLDIGANIGAFTIPLAKRVGEWGRVHAFEPQKLINQHLNANIVLNGLDNVDVYHAALGSQSGSISVPYLNYSMDSNFGSLSLVQPIENQTRQWSYNVTMLTLDSIDFANPYTGKDCPSFIKMDVEMMEKPVLQGGLKLISRCRPIIHAENNEERTSAALIEQIYSMDYVPFWDIKPAYNAAFQGTIIDITDGYHNMNIICIPTERLESKGGNVIMQGFTQVQRDKPMLRDYFLEQLEDGTIVPRHRQHH